jgi:hypothetical protein
MGRHAVTNGRTVDIIAAALGGIMTVLVLLLSRLRRDRITARIVDGRSPVIPWGIATLAALTSTAAVVVSVSIATSKFK